MKKIIFSILIALSCAGFAQSALAQNKPKQTIDSILAETKEIKSNFIDESYVVSVSVPAGYDGKKKYPVVFLMDSNIYFDIVAQVLRHYRESVNMPEAILVGVGYKDYTTTDKLRSRDFTYPSALPEYKIPMLTGGAKEFLAFVNLQVVPYIDANYAVDTSQRILMGHSLGGYFTVFAMYENLIAKNNIYSGYIAASPTVFYNGNYLIKQFSSVNLDNKGKTKAYITFGEAEDTEFSAVMPIKRVDVLVDLEKIIKDKNGINYSSDLYTALQHADTPLPSFIKGINLMLKK